jgi:NDP-sugar pyrophosphorylase family protein
MKQPALVVMAAGMGSRYGGLKQMDPIDENGNVIIHYSLFDAYRAGFRKVVFIIKETIDADFRAMIGSKIPRMMDVQYAYQNVTDLPAGYSVPEGRTKPWGTAHAALSARELIDGPFAIINADDYYGVDAFKTIFDYLSTHADTPDCYEYSMVGYLLENTVTENGSVARGVCSCNDQGYLDNVVERTKIVKGEVMPRFTEDDGATWTDLPGSTIVSMNIWGFNRSYLDEAMARFPAFLDAAVQTNPLKAEFYLPTVVSQLLEEKKARVRVLSSRDKWYGVTYKEDKPVVVAALKALRDAGVYPKDLWGNE